MMRFQGGHGVPPFTACSVVAPRRSTPLAFAPSEQHRRGRGPRRAREGSLRSRAAEASRTTPGAGPRRGSSRALPSNSSSPTITASPSRADRVQRWAVARLAAATAASAGAGSDRPIASLSDPARFAWDPAPREQVHLLPRARGRVYCGRSPPGPPASVGFRLRRDPTWSRCTSATAMLEIAAHGTRAVGRS